MSFQSDSIFWVETAKIVPNPYQPRREFDEDRLKELADSIRMYGILQPLTVTRKEIQREDGTFYSEYELIAGERRLRASSIAGVSQVPVIIRDGEQSEQEKLELAIIENLQREDLNAVDRALAFKQLADAFSLSHVDVAKKVGRSREYVSNSIRLLQLPEHMLTSLKQGDIAEGHARTLLMLNDKPEEQETVFREVLLKKLSVREVERIARKIATDKVRKKDWHGLDPELVDIERQLTETLGTRVHIVKTDFGGKVTIDYFSATDLTSMLALLKREQENATGPMTASETIEKITQHTPLQTVAPNPSEVSPTAAPAEPTPEQTPKAMSEPAVETPEVAESTPEAVTTEHKIDEPEPEPATEPVSEPVAEPAREEVATNPEPAPRPSFEPVTAAEPPADAPSADFERAPTPVPESEAPTEPVMSPTAQTGSELEAQPPTVDEQKPAPELQPTPGAEPAAEPKKSEFDDSSLYSIRNFSV